MAEIDHLRLAFGHEGGGGGRRVETAEINHLQLAFGCEGGGGGGTGSRIDEKTTSGSCLDAREVVVVGGASKWLKWTTSGLHLDAREVVVGDVVCMNLDSPGVHWIDQ